MTKPVDEEILKTFYRNVKPWGFWGPIKAKVMAEDPSFAPNSNFKADMLNVLIGVVWQTSLVILPIYIVLQQGMPIAVTAVIALVSSVLLKKLWFDKLPSDKPQFSSAA